MRKFLFLMLTIGFLNSLTGQEFSSLPDIPLSELQNTIKSFGIRAEGSPSEQAAALWLKNQISDLNLPVQEDDFFSGEDMHSFSQTLRWTIRGDSPDSLIIAAPLSQEPGREDVRALNLALLVALSQRYAEQRPSLTLRFLALGAESGPSESYPMGSRKFLSDFFPENPVAVLYLDMDFAPQRVRVLTDSGDNIAPIWMVLSLIRNMRASNVGFLLQGNHPQLFRFDIPERRNILKPYFDADIPALALQSTGARRTEDGPTWTASFFDMVDGFLEENAQGLPTYWDHHYLFFQIQNQYLFLGQEVYLMILIGIFALIALATLIWPMKFRESVSIVWRHLWQLPVALIFLFLFFFLATQGIQAIFALRNFEGLWEYQPLAFLGFKLLLTLFLFFLSFYLIKRMPLNRWARFYSHSSVFVMTIGLFLSLFFGLSLSFYFLWSLVLAILAAVIPHRPLKLLAILAAPFWLVKGLIDIFTAGESVLIEQLLLNPLLGNLVLAFLVFPYLLLYSSFHFIKHQRPERNDRFRAIIISMVLGYAALGVGVFLLFFVPFTQGQEQPILLSETWSTLSQRRVLSVRSPVPLNEVTLELGPETVEVPQGQRSLLANLLPENPPVTTVLSQSDFLSRRTWTVDFSSQYALEDLRVLLRSSTPFVLFECSFPYRIEPNGRLAEIFIGRYPPQEMQVSFTLPQDVSLVLDWEYRGTALPEGLELSRDDLDPETSFIITGSLELEGASMGESLVEEESQQDV